MIIDCHTHILPSHIKKNRNKYVDTDACFAILYSNRDAKLVTADDLVHSMDKAGIDLAVVVNIGWTTHDLCVETNDYILESVAHYPQRLIGFCAIQPWSPQAAVAEIERCARGGARGIGELRPDMQLFDLRDEELMSPLVEVIQQYKLTLMVHASEPVGHQYPGKGSITPDMLYPFIARYPGLPLVCAHWGGGLPFYALMPEVKEALHHVFFDTAASPFLYTPQIYYQVIQLVGAEKILFGTDYPLLPQSRLLAEVSALDLSERDRELILSGNARRLLGIDESLG